MSTFPPFYFTLMGLVGAIALFTGTIAILGFGYTKTAAVTFFVGCMSLLLFIYSAFNGL